MTSTIMVDFDSTINNFNPAFLGAINTKFGTHFDYEDCTTWDFMHCLGKSGLTQEMESYGWKLWDSKGFTMALWPLPGAIQALHDLTDAGHEVFVVSSRPLHHGQWLREWLDYMGLDQIQAWAQPDKLSFAREFGVTLAFDDSPDHALKLSTHCPVYLIDHPWNQDVVDDNITRVESLWHGVQEVVGGYEG